MTPHRSSAAAAPQQKRSTGDWRAWGNGRVAGGRRRSRRPHRSLLPAQRPSSGLQLSWRRRGVVSLLSQHCCRLALVAIAVAACVPAAILLLLLLLSLLPLPLLLLLLLLSLLLPLLLLRAEASWRSQGRAPAPARGSERRQSRAMDRSLDARRQAPQLSEAPRDAWLDPTPRDPSHPRASHHIQKVTCFGHLFAYRKEHLFAYNACLAYCACHAY